MECSETDWQRSHVQPEVVEVVIVRHQKLPLRASETHATEIGWAAKMTGMSESIRRMKGPPFDFFRKHFVRGSKI